MHKIKKITTESPEYQSVLLLRDLVLRKPLGMNLFDENLEGDKEEIIFGIFNENEEALASVQFKILDNLSVKLRQMAVHPEHQKKGLGKSLVQFAEQQVKNLGYKKIEMHARKTAIPFYEKLGYKKEGEEFMEVGIPHYKMCKEL